MIWDLGLLAPNGTIVVDNVLFFGDPYTKEGFMGKLGEGVTNFNELIRQDESVHKVLAYILLHKNMKCIGTGIFNASIVDIIKKSDIGHAYI